jgi:hypothetical protein
MALQSNFKNSNLEFSATAKKVVIRQLLIAATKKCSGDHIPGMPLGNSGGVATSIDSGNSGELTIPFRSSCHVKSISYLNIVLVILNFFVCLYAIYQDFSGADDIFGGTQW